jgi:hypothetical protein
MKVTLTLDLPDAIAEKLQNDPEVKARVQTWIEEKYQAEVSKKKILDTLLGNK